MQIRYFGHIARHSSLEKDLMLGRVMPGTRCSGGQRHQWLDDVKDLASMGLSDLVHLVEDREGFREFMHRIVKAPREV